MFHNRIVARTSTFHAANSLTGGRLADLMAKWNSEGITLVEQKRRLNETFGLDLSISTIWRWQSDYVPVTR